MALGDSVGPPVEPMPAVVTGREGAASNQARPRYATRQAVSHRTPCLGCSPRGADPVSGGVSTATHRTCRCTQAGALAQHHAKRFAIGSWCQPVTTNGPGCQPVTLGAWKSSRPGSPFLSQLPGQPFTSQLPNESKMYSPMRAMTTTTGPVHIVRAFGPDE